MPWVVWCGYCDHAAVHVAVGHCRCCRCCNGLFWLFGCCQFIQSAQAAGVMYYSNSKEFLPSAVMIEPVLLASCSDATVAHDQTEIVPLCFLERLHTRKHIIEGCNNFAEGMHRMSSQHPVTAARTARQDKTFSIASGPFPCPHQSSASKSSRVRQGCKYAHLSKCSPS